LLNEFRRGKKKREEWAEGGDRQDEMG